ncbi:alpha-ribazole-5'-phosphate phosphatase [Marinobacterium nitratireducens]|uniref:Alpha-ribazole-5'-phosphate phosphatase n=1 Tax=Marinobacterium nitratireducens TaxID=518897 RepID=A0A917ZHT4_9GAMM|nr:histidine phosphatase family protein [Marinobacterium nitratireducens]GGO82921.1 alpha-ribazole-5'-phosphate phosphatase [Marinobacterium nitratireducens]
MPALTLDLLRHGDADGTGAYRGRSDPALTPQGLAQMRGWERASPGWSRVLCSPLRRCREPAQRLAAALSLPLVVEEALIEYDFGDWDGRRYDEVWRDDRERVLAFWQDPAASPPPGGESIASLCARVEGLVSRLAAGEDRHLLLLTHGGVIRALIGTRLGLPAAAWSQLRIDTGSLSRVNIGLDPDNPWFELVYLNRLPSGRLDP